MKCGLFVEPRRGHVVPFLEWREIQRGRNAGRIEIARPGRRPARVIVEQDVVRRWPGRKGTD